MRPATLDAPRRAAGGGRGDRRLRRGDGPVRRRGRRRRLDRRSRRASPAGRSSSSSTCARRRPARRRVVRGFAPIAGTSASPASSSTASAARAMRRCLRDACDGDARHRPCSARLPRRRPRACRSAISAWSRRASTRASRPSSTARPTLRADAIDRALRCAPVARAGRRSPGAPAIRRSPIPPLGQRIAVADDAAFAFRYPPVIEGWRAAGAEISRSRRSPTRRPAADADAVYLPGGYPELHAGRLAGNARFLDGLRAAAGRGAAIFGECGGYMVMGEALDRRRRRAPSDGRPAAARNLLRRTAAAPRLSRRLARRATARWARAARAFAATNSTTRGRFAKGRASRCSPAADAAGRDLGRDRFGRRRASSAPSST